MPRRFEQLADRNAEHVCDTGETAGAYPVGALLVFLHLLKSDADLLGKIGLADSVMNTQNTNSGSHHRIEGVGCPGRHICVSTAPNCWPKLAQLMTRCEIPMVVKRRFPLIRKFCAGAPACRQDRSRRWSGAPRQREISAASAGSRRAMRTGHASIQKSRAPVRHTITQTAPGFGIGTKPRTACRWHRPDRFPWNDS